MTALPFAALRVLDLSTEIAGAYCTKLLVDQGADVILVETPGGDPLRRWVASGTPLPPGEDAPLFRFLRAGVRSVVAGRDRVLELARDADVVVESATLGAFGLTVDEVRAAAPAASVVSLTPWGTTGPWADRPATEFIVQAACGGTGRRGLPWRDPVTAGGRLAEWLLGTFGAVGALTAWYHRRRTGEGQHVDVSMLEACNLTLNGPYQMIAAHWAPALRIPRMIEVPSIEPARDGSVGFSTQTAQQWLDFCVMIGRPELGEDPATRRADVRMQRIDEIRSAIAAYAAEHDVAEIIELAEAMRIPVAPVGNGQSLPGMDHFVARDVYVENPHGFTQPRVPYVLHGHEPRPFAPAPSLGASPNASWNDASAEPEWRLGPADRPFAGLKVADFSAFWAGPFASLYLDALGAQVVKIESIQRPDGIRYLGGLDRDHVWEWSMVFHGANPGKTDITLDLTQPQGLELAKRIIAESDVLIENFSVRVMESFGLGWDEVHALNPNLVMVRMPAYGLDGPWRDRVGFAMTIEQVSGLAWVTGYDDLPLVPRGPCDPIGGMHTIVALLAALETRARTGQGLLVEVPLVEAALNLGAEQVIEWSAHGVLLGRSENRGPYAAPQGIYRCSGDEDHLALAVATDEQWHALAPIVGLDTDVSLHDASARHRDHDRVDDAIRAWIADRPAQACADELVAAGIPATRVVLSHEALPNEQLEHRGFVQTFAHPITGDTIYPGFPMRFSAYGPGAYRGPAPLLGQHNERVLHDRLGLGADEIEALREHQVIGERPIGF